MARASLEPRPRGLSLERKLPLWISALLVLVVAAAAGASFFEVRDSARAAAEERLRRITRQLAESSENNTAQRMALVRRVAGDRRIASLLDGGNDSTIPADAVEDLITAPDSSAVFEVRDATGRRRAWTSVLDRVDELHASALAARIVATDSALGTALFVRGDSVLYWAGAPIRRGGRTVGALLQRRVLVNTPRAEEQIRNLLGRDVTLRIANADNSVWTTVTGRALHVPDSVGRLDSLFSYREGGRRYIASAVPVRGSAWAILTYVPLRAVMERPVTFLRRMSLFLLVLAVIGTTAAWLLGRHLTRPLSTLRDAAAMVAAGAEPPAIRVRSDDELGQLSATFNEMASRVRQAREQLERQVAEARALAERLEQSERDARATARRTVRLQAVTAALSSAVTPEEIASVVMEQGISAVDASAGSVLLLSADGTHLEFLRAVGYPPHILERYHRVPVDANVPLAMALRRGEADFIETPAQWAARFPAGEAPATLPDSRAWASLPLSVHGRVIGVMGLSFNRESPFDEEQRAFMRTLAEQCAQALDRAHLYQAERETRREAEDARARADEARHLAEAANQSKSDFLAIMSHELRTPLNAIGGYTELLSMGLRGPVTREQQEDLDRIQKSQQHLLTLINDVLHFAKLDAGRVEYHLEDVPVDELLETLEPLVGPQIRGKSLHYHHRRCSPVLRVRADREKLRQVALNLLSNAVKFTPRGGAIEVSCDGDETHVRIHVRDTGVGIPAERLDAIFDPFFQVDRRLTRSHDGIGLGLAISRDLARGMEGELSVRSVVGEGSTFTVTLPRAGVVAGVITDGAGKSTV